MILTGTKASLRLICACTNFADFRYMKGGKKRERDIGLEYHGLINYKFAMDVRFRRKFATDLAMVFFPSEICDELFCHRFIFRRKFATNIFPLQICDGIFFRPLDKSVEVANVLL